MRNYDHQPSLQREQASKPIHRLTEVAHEAPHRSPPPVGRLLDSGLQRPVVLLRRPQVLDKLGICRSALHQWLDPESPYYLPAMPRPIKLSERSRSSYWIEEEIDLFIEQCVAQARKSGLEGAQ